MRLSWQRKAGKSLNSGGRNGFTELMAQATEKILQLVSAAFTDPGTRWTTNQDTISHPARYPYPSGGVSMAALICGSIRRADSSPMRTSS
jgi:hypothetical protein